MPKDGQPHTQGGRVAVVVPSYNHSQFVAATLRSIFAQTLAPARLLVIDDGSSDGSPQVIGDVLKDCPFPCELIARENRGICATLNEGLAKTEGEYFAYLGSDDLWLPGFLEARAAQLDARPRAVLAYGHSYLIDEADTIYDCTRDWARYRDGDARAMLLEEVFAPMSPTVVHRRAAVERHGWNESARLEDYELYLKLSADGDFAFDPSVLAAWRRHSRNTSGDFIWMIEARLEAQSNAAAHLGLSPAQLKRYHGGLNFTGAEDLLRLGQKRAALRYLRRGLFAAPSPAAVGRFALRFLTPYYFVRLHKRRRRMRTARRHGKVQQVKIQDV